MTHPNKPQEELKPCPFCKEIGVLVGSIYVYCYTPDCPLYGNEVSLKDWNSAFCWKELSRKDALLREAIVIIEQTEYRNTRDIGEFLEKARGEVKDA